MLPQKLFFRIGEVAGLVGVEPHVLRYWEREFRSIRPTKSAKGQRVYSRKDVENLLRVRDLLYRDGFTIAGAKKKLQRGSAADADPATDEALDLAAPTHAVGPTHATIAPTHATIAPTHATIAPTHATIAPTVAVAPTHAIAPTVAIAPTHAIAPTVAVAPTHAIAPTVAVAPTATPNVAVTHAVAHAAIAPTHAIAPPQVVVASPAPTELAASPPRATDPPALPAAQVRAKLLALRDEVEEFLAELSASGRR